MRPSRQGFGDAVRSCSSWLFSFCVCVCVPSFSERRGGQRGAAVVGQTGLVLAGQLATPPRAAQDHDGETGAQGRPLLF